MIGQDLSLKYFRGELFELNDRYSAISCFDLEGTEGPVLHDGLLRVFKGERFCFDVLLNGFDGRSLEKASQDVLVCFTAAIPSGKRGESLPPYFSGLNIAKQIDLPIISVADPTLYIDPELQLSWYLGNKFNTRLHQDIVNFFLKIRSFNDLVFTFFGGSGGGFASLMIGERVKKCNVAIWNPQIVIPKYNKTVVLKYLECAFDFVPTDFAKDVVGFMENHSLPYDISNIDVSGLLGLVYLQNKSDHSHVESHFKKFVSGRPCSTIEAINGQKLVKLECSNSLCYKGNWGQGHKRPPKSMIEFSINLLLSGSLNQEVLQSFAELEAS